MKHNITVIGNLRCVSCVCIVSFHSPGPCYILRSRRELSARAARTRAFLPASSSSFPVGRNFPPRSSESTLFPRRLRRVNGPLNPARACDLWAPPRHRATDNNYYAILIPSPNGPSRVSWCPSQSHLKFHPPDLR